MEEVVKTTKGPSKMQIAQAVSNSSDEFFEFGGKQFKLLDLCYDDYIEFVEHMSPFIEKVMKASMSDNMDIMGFVRFAGKGLPRMVWLMIHKQDEAVTEDWVKENAGTPYVLAELAFRQVVKNRMIEEFARFFASLSQKIVSLGVL